MTKTLMVFVALLFAAHEAGAQNASLKILVVAGEGAVNIIQQKTAVSPIVEIRDRNNLPVSGATVTFSIGGGNSAAFTGGAQTLTVTTNAAGRAAAAAPNPIGGGSFQIQVSAAFQGQTAAATIAQTNVLTVAEAAAGASGVGGGALAATQVVGGSGNGVEAPPRTYTGSFTGQLAFNQNSGGIICDSTRAITGTVTMGLEDGASTGSANVSGTERACQSSAELRAGSSLAT